jgi:hypothetical protein
MRHFDRVRFTESTRVNTLKVLEEQSDHPALNAWLTQSDTEKAG